MQNSSGGWPKAAAFARFTTPAKLGPATERRKGVQVAQTHQISQIRGSVRPPALTAITRERVLLPCESSDLKIGSPSRGS
jgi:hypothetical protein